MIRPCGIGLAATLGVSGCATAPPLDNPVQVRSAEMAIENPVLVSPGVPTASSYQEVFEKCIDVLDDYFEVREANPYAGRIVSKPRIAPGYEQFWKSGNPDARSRLMATFQSIRQIATIEIRTGERGGYLVYVVVEKELEDVSRPTVARIGSAVFQDAPNVERQVEVVSASTSPSQGWFRIGRDYATEQAILQRLRQCR